MKKTILVSIIALCFFSSCNESTNPITTFGDKSAIESNDISLSKKALPNNIYMKVFRAEGTVSVDGDESEWANVPKRIMRKYFLTNNPYTQKFPIVNKFDLSAYFKLLWDDDNFYVLLHIVDDEINVNADPNEPYLMDSFELFIDPDNSKNTPPDEGIYPIWPGTYDSNDDHIRFVWNEVPVSVHGHTEIAAIEYAYLQTDYGWNLEIKIPFVAFTDFNAEPGKIFGIDFHINDNDNDNRENMLKWWSENDYTWGYPSLFGSAYLIDQIAD